MNLLAVASALAGFVVTLGSLILYFRTIPRGKVPVKISGFVSKLVAGIALAALGIYFGATGTGSAGVLVYLPAGLALFFGLFILWVLTQRKTPLGKIRVKLGEPIPPFAALNSDGQPFDSAEFRGKRVLLKFFRGGWCPYCSAELSAFNAMRPDLEKFKVEIYAISKDVPEEAALHKRRDGLEFPLLSDPDLKVIRAYGLEHRKALGQTRNPNSTIGGVPIGLAPFNFQSMAIPTTILIDEAGIIRWIDQSDDYRIRSSTARVTEAIGQAFTPGALAA